MLAPSKFLAESEIEKIQGLYVPFYYNDIETHLNAGFMADKKTSTSNELGTEHITTTYLASLETDFNFGHIPVDASIKLNNDLLDALEPFPYEKCVPFNPAYMAGFLAEQADEDAAMISTRQQQMMMLANGAANYDIQTQMAQGFAKGAEKGGIQNMMGMGMIMGGMGGLGGLGNVGSTQPMYNQQYGRQPQSAPMQPQMGVVASGMPQQTNAPQQASVAAQDDSWVCSCGTTVSGNFCPQCGKKKEAKMEMPSNTWTCPTCHTENTMLFCGNCGTKRPERKQIVVCDKCHWTSENTSIRFCPQCGDHVTDADLQ